MAKPLFPAGIITVEIDGVGMSMAEFMGRQQGVDCMVCRNGGNCYTFNLFTDVQSYRQGEYETMGFGRDHLNHVKLVETST